MHNQYYPFDIKCKRMMMKIDINAFFKLGDAFFEIHEMEDGSIRMFWRKAVPERKYAEYAGAIARKYYEGKLMHLKELILTDEYKKEMDIISPINEVLLSDEELCPIIELCNKGIPGDYKRIGGRDGHSYDIWFEKSKRYSLWCWVHESLEPVANVINMLVDKAGLDRQRYGIRVQK